MIAHSIETARRSGTVKSVIVSTDDAEIADVARQYGAEVPFLRPAELADDHTGTTAVVRHAVRSLLEEGRDVTLVCCLYATAPLVTPELLAAGLRALQESGASYAFSVGRYAAPIQRALRVRADGRVEPFWPEHRDTRSQDLEPAFHDAGQFYWGTAQAWLDALPIHADTSVPVVLPPERIQDVDTPEDWRRAELLHALLEAERRG
jgi:pseudaminic acid cytidylyltransferase